MVLLSALLNGFRVYMSAGDNGEVLVAIFEARIRCTNFKEQVSDSNWFIEAGAEGLMVIKEDDAEGLMVIKEDDDNSW